jgi:hypothetical protein
LANGDFIRIDVLTGASAGGMTAAILTQKLLFAKNSFVAADGKPSPYDNPLYNTWVRGIDLQGLLDAKDEPLPDGDPATLSVLSSNLIEKIAAKTLAQTDASGQIPVNGGAHNVIDPASGISVHLHRNSQDPSRAVKFNSFHRAACNRFNSNHLQTPNFINLQ